EAARSGERALDQLRRLEDQLSTHNSPTAARAGSDVRLEAQQIAQEQRRIASEASRLERNSDATTTDARRRLADDQERLASRVDEMTRNAERSAQGASGADSRALADAAQSLRRDKVSERMRAGA